MSVLPLTRLLITASCAYHRLWQLPCAAAAFQLWEAGVRKIVRAAEQAGRPIRMGLVVENLD